FSQNLPAMLPMNRWALSLSVGTPRCGVRERYPPLPPDPRTAQRAVPTKGRQFGNRPSLFSSPRFLFTDFVFSNMFRFRFSIMKQLIASILFCVLALTLRAEDLRTSDAFRAAAAKANSILTLPDWEQTPEAVDASMTTAIAT